MTTATSRLSRPKWEKHYTYDGKFLDVLLYKASNGRSFGCTLCLQEGVAAQCVAPAVGDSPLQAADLAAGVLEAQLGRALTEEERKRIDVVVAAAILGKWLR